MRAASHENDAQVTPVSEEAVEDFLRSIIDGIDTPTAASLPVSDEPPYPRLCPGTFQRGPGGRQDLALTPQPRLNHQTSAEASSSCQSTPKRPMEEGEIIDPTLPGLYRANLPSVVLMNLNRRQVAQDDEEGNADDKDLERRVVNELTEDVCGHFDQLNKRVGSELVSRRVLEKAATTVDNERQDSHFGVSSPMSLAATSGDLVAPVRQPTPENNTTVQACHANDRGSDAPTHSHSPSTHNRDEEPCARKDTEFRYTPPRGPSHHRRNNQLASSAQKRDYDSRSPPRHRNNTTPTRYRSTTPTRDRRRHLDDLDDGYRRSPSKRRRDIDYSDPSSSRSSRSPTPPKYVHRLPGRSYDDDSKSFRDSRPYRDRPRMKSPIPIRRAPILHTPRRMRSPDERVDDRKTQLSWPKRLEPDDKDAKLPPPRLTVVTKVDHKPSPSSPVEPTSATSNTTTAVDSNPYDNPIPSLLAATVGLPNAAILPIEFALDSETSRQLCGAHSDAKSSPSDKPPIMIQLLCISYDDASIISSMASDGASPSALAERALASKTVWPPQGDLIVEVNKDSPCHKTWMPRDLGPSDHPLNLTQFVQEELNTVRVIQLTDMSAYVFVVVASLASVERHADPVSFAKILSDSSNRGCLAIPTRTISS